MTDSLYEISNNYRALLDLDPEGDADMAEAIKNTLDGIDDEFDAKANAVAAYRCSIEARAEMFGNEIARLQQRKKSLATQANNLADYLKTNMLQLGKTKIDSGLFRITVIKPRQTAAITNLDLLDAKYTTLVRQPIKAEILKALKAGEVVAGAEIALSDHGLRIA